MALYQIQPLCNRPHLRANRMAQEVKLFPTTTKPQKATKYWWPLLSFVPQIVAPQVGLEPTTLRLTAECSAIELLRSIWWRSSYSRWLSRKSTGGQTQPQYPAQTCAPPQSARISPALIP